MRYSRLRLKLAGWFAVAILLSLALLDVALFITLEHQADARLSRRIISVAQEMAQAVEREGVERAGSAGPTLAQAAQEALDEWPAGSEAFAIYDEHGTQVVGQGRSTMLAALPPVGQLPRQGRTRNLPLDSEGDARVAAATGQVPERFTVVALTYTGGLREDAESLALLLLLSAPVVVLIAVAAGYALAQRALQPFGGMASELERIAPEALAYRLAINQPPDELDRLADQINRLLARIQGAQEQNRQFLRQAAHQLRTPLTLVTGESQLALERPRSPKEYEIALRRVQLAAQQMARRVDELFLLARAQAGEVLARPESVELDAVAIDASDLMRGRAQALGRRISLGPVASVEVNGDEALLREAVVELIENACRHGTAEQPIELAVGERNGSAFVRVSSSGGPIPAIALTEESGNESSRGIGLSVVRWIAHAHDGGLVYEAITGRNIMELRLPRRPG
jgi:signal transduction histidine kinase